MVAVRLIPSSRRNHTFLVMVDEDNRELLNERGWCLASFACYIRRADLKGSTEALHRLIVDAKEGDIVDHINTNTTDNRKANLRIVTANQNMHNRKLNKNSKTGIKGVIFERTNKWRGMVAFNGKKFRRAFTTKEAAAYWVRAKREELHGEYARHA